MAIVSRQQIYSWFLDFLKPNEKHFAAITDSHWHKTEDLIPQDRIENWNEFLQTLPDSGTLKNYALRDAHNLEASDVVSWQQALGYMKVDFSNAKFENWTGAYSRVLLADAGTKKVALTSFENLPFFPKIKPSYLKNYTKQGCPFEIKNQGANNVIMTKTGVRVTYKNPDTNLKVIIPPVDTNEGPGSFSPGTYYFHRDGSDGSLLEDIVFETFKNYISQARIDEYNDVVANGLGGVMLTEQQIQSLYADLHQKTEGVDYNVLTPITKELVDVDFSTDGEFDGKVVKLEIPFSDCPLVLSKTSGGYLDLYNIMLCLSVSNFYVETEIADQHFDYGDIQISYNVEGNYYRFKPVKNNNVLHKKFSTFPKDPDAGQIVNLIINDDENVSTSIVTLNQNGKETAGFYEYDGTKWRQFANNSNGIDMKGIYQSGTTLRGVYTTPTNFNKK